MSNSDNEIDQALGGQSGQPTPASTGVPAAGVPADLAAIQAMVDAGVVVGSDPEPAVPAAQRRAEIEAELAVKGLKPAEPEPDSESSSEFESSSEEEDEPKAKKPVPLTNEEQSELRNKLDKFYGYDVMSDSEEEELDEEEDAELAMMEAMGLDDDSGPVMSAHEQPLPPVSAPPISQLPADMPTTCAGEIVSWMKDKAVENWLAKKEKGEVEGEKEPKEEAKDEAMAEVKPEPEKPAEPTPSTEEQPDVEMGDSASADAPAATETKPAETPAKPAEPKFTSSGTLIIKALPLPGYLESGSILATSSGAVLGVVYDTFGPLSQPFYNLRLPPPPYPIPQISAGDKVYVPASEEYRFFVDMNAVRDPRFRSDASNVYDEEVGEDEREWSDDEKEAEAKRLKKAKRKAKRGGATGGDGRPPTDLPSHLPPRPGGLPVYDDETPSGAPGGQRGRGQGRQERGRGRGGKGRGQGRPMGGREQQQFPGFTNNPQGYPNMPYSPAGYNPMQPGFGMNPMMGGMMGMPMQGMQAMPMNMGGFYGGQQYGQYQQGQYGGQQGGQGGYGQQQQQGGQQGNAPAINPRFAQQYGFWPGQQGQGGQGGQGGDPPYSE